MQKLGTDLKRLKQRQGRTLIRADGPQAQLPRELGERLLDHLEGLSISPGRVLNIGEGPGWLHQALGQRFPKSTLIHTDFNPSLLKALAPSSRLRRWLTGRPLGFSARADQLPIATASIDLIILQGISPGYELGKLFSECRRVLNKEGLILLWAFGPDTLKEWRQATQNSPFYQAPLAFIDMHDVADALSHAGFASPVMDMEVLGIQYLNAQALLKDLKTLLGSDAFQERTPGLKTPGALAKVLAALPPAKEEGFSITLEALYGHAWSPSALQSASGHRIIPITKA